jgi:hypothetical protein
MRLTVSALRSAVKRDLPVVFGAERLTSYAGLELVSRYFRRIDLSARVRRVLAPVEVDSDYGAFRLVLVVIGLVLVGGRRTEHLRYLSRDPLFARFCGLRRLPTERTVANWLKRFTMAGVRALGTLVTDLVFEQAERLGLSRLTIDLDGTVLRTGTQVGWAVRGFNPHHPKDPSYYPLLAHLAQTGQILRVKNRPGNVNDSRGAEEMVRELVGEIRSRFGKRLPIEFRMDAAFFQEKLLKRLSRLGCGYAIKVPFWQWLGLKKLVAAQKQWTRITEGIDAFETMLAVPQWDLSLRVVVYRKRVHHRSPKNFQLDLFDPDDGYFEYSAVTSNLELQPKALWEFASGRGAHEKIIGELKGECAFDVIPTNHYAANSAWQYLSVLAHNLIRSFQLDADIALLKPRSLKRTFAHRIMSLRTVRFLLIARAGRIARIRGRQVLRLSDNPATKDLYQRVGHALAA